MLGATLRVKSLVADLCRANSGVSTLVLDTNDLFIDEVLKKDRFTQKVPFSSEPSADIRDRFLAILQLFCLYSISLVSDLACQGRAHIGAKPGPGKLEIEQRLNRIWV